MRKRMIAWPDATGHSEQSRDREGAVKKHPLAHTRGYLTAYYCMTEE